MIERFLLAYLLTGVLFAGSVVLWLLEWRKPSLRELTDLELLGAFVLLFVGVAVAWFPLVALYVWAWWTDTKPATAPAVAVWEESDIAPPCKRQVITSVEEYRAAGGGPELEPAVRWYLNTADKRPLYLVTVDDSEPLPAADFSELPDLQEFEQRIGAPREGSR